MRPATPESGIAVGRTDLPLVDDRTFLRTTEAMFRWVAVRHHEGRPFWLRELDAWIGNLFTNIRGYGCLALECPAASSMIAIDTSGKVYACDVHSNSQDAVIAPSLTALMADPTAALSAWHDAAILPSRCRACALRTICGGGCAGESLAANGQRSPSPYCTAIQELVPWIIDQYCTEAPFQDYVDAAMVRCMERNGAVVRRPDA